MAPGNQCKGEASRSEELAAGRRAVYAMFNNVSMLDDAQHFQSLLAGSAVSPDLAGRRISS